MYGPDGSLIGRLYHIVENQHIADNSVAYTDLLLDLWIDPDGAIREFDRDELEQALAEGKLTAEQIGKIEATARRIRAEQEHTQMTADSTAAQAHAANIERFSGFADTYDDYRPQPPEAFVDLLVQLVLANPPALVVDIGSGTGLSTRIWSARAEQVIGIEPNADMRREAEERTASLPHARNVTYREGLSTATGLPDACADIVTCSQCLHWLEPEPTFAEIARILRPGGIFAAIDCDWPPTMHVEAEEAWHRFMRRARELETSLGIDRIVKHAAKDQHLSRMRDSGRFRYTREVLLHNVEEGNAERLVGLARSFGGVATVLSRGVSETEIGLDVLAQEARQHLGDEPLPWYFSYRVRLGVR
jgi:SAM-dependent methyltransferase